LIDPKKGLLSALCSKDFVVHIPYAVGLLFVCLGDKITPDTYIESYFLDDYKVILDSFEEQSDQVLFDGILILKYLTKNTMYRFKLLICDGYMYECMVYCNVSININLFILDCFINLNNYGLNYKKIKQLTRYLFAWETRALMWHVSFTS
jgi:hypothetical protein